MLPRLFEPWALQLLDECNLGPSAVILDVATGPGTVARLAAKHIGPGGRVVATDISRPMLDVANSKSPSPDPRQLPISNHRRHLWELRPRRSILGVPTGSAVLS
jgi:SAM-dependent methyltransferase